MIIRVAHKACIAHALSSITTTVPIISTPNAAVSICALCTERRFSIAAIVIIWITGHTELVNALSEPKAGALLIDGTLYARTSVPLFEADRRLSRTSLIRAHLAARARSGEAEPSFGGTIVAITTCRALGDALVENTERIRATTPCVVCGITCTADTTRTLAESWVITIIIG